MKKLVLILMLFLTLQGYTQEYKRAYNWYFSDSIGISFGTNPPSVLTKGSLSNAEGSSAVISDTSGQLLFYTDGQNIWNKNHVFMQNGTGLNGSWDATQPAIIVPQPENDSLYYVFTVDAVGQAKGLQYSIVNIKADGGLGAVILKNIQLQTPVCEKLAATKHQNRKDVWVIAHGFGNDLFYGYLITRNGIINCPVINSIGATHSTSSVLNTQGAMKFSADGRKLAVTVFDSDNSRIDLFDFDNSNGKLLNYVPITNIYLPFGIEFSLNAKYLYSSTRPNELLTFDLSKYNQIDIENSKTILVDYPNIGWRPVLLQIASNSKIYLTYPDSFHLGEISYPDSGTTKSAYSEFSLTTGNKRTKSGGLPNFISSYFYQPKLDFAYSASCSNSIVTFEGKASFTSSSWNWRIRQISNNSVTNYGGSNISHNFSDSGLYEVRLIANNDTVVKNIFIDAPILPLVDTLGCGVDSVVLKIPDSYRCLQWSDTAASLYNRIIKTNGTYTLQGYNSNGCLITDSIRINFTPPATKPIITKINDSLQSSPASTYQWLLNDTLLAGAVSQSIKPMKAGLYKVIVTDNYGCSNMSTAFSSNVGIKPVSLGSIHIYPNPANDKLYIESDNKIAEVKIYDVTGRIVYEQSTISDSSLQINCTKFIRGIYFIQVLTNNTHTYHNKIIILS